MIKQLLASLAVALIAGGVALADEVPDPEQLACPANASRRAVKLAGTAAGYPAPCALQVCRALGKVAEKTHLATDPLCNPIFGSCTYVAIDWRYQVQAGAEPVTHCPADVLAGPWN